MPQQHRSRELKAEMLLIAVVLIWAGHYPLAKYALGTMNAFVFNSLRYIIAALVVLIIMRTREPWAPVTEWKRLIVTGIIASVIYQIIFIIGLDLTTAGNAAIMLATSPIWTVFLHARIHREKLRASIWAGMLVSLAGVILIIIGSGKKMQWGGHELAGDLVSLAAAAFWGLNSTLQKPLLAKHSAMQLQVIMISIGAIGLTIAALPVFPAVQWSTIPFSVYGATLLSGVFSIGIANVFWSYGIKHLGPGRTANFYNLVPIIAFILAYLTLHETVLPIQIAGALITVCGVWFVRSTSAKIPPQ